MLIDSSRSKRFHSNQEHFIWLWLFFCRMKTFDTFEIFVPRLWLGLSYRFVEWSFCLIKSNTFHFMSRVFKQTLKFVTEMVIPNFSFFFQSKKEFKYTISNKTAIKPSIVEYEASGVHFLQEPCKLVLVPLNMAPSLRHGYLYQSEGIVRFEAPKESTGVHHIWTWTSKVELDETFALTFNRIPK